MLVEQEKLRSNPAFDQQYRDLIERWKSGPEEYLVTGAEAYLTEVLDLRTHEECVSYLQQQQNGGMPLSLAVYRRLRENRPDRDPAWAGFGPWATEELRAGRLRVAEPIEAEGESA